MMYRGKKRTEVAPHLYAISDNAYSNMLRGEYHHLEKSSRNNSRVYYIREYFYVSFEQHTLQFIRLGESRTK